MASILVTHKVVVPIITVMIIINTNTTLPFKFVFNFLVCTLVFIQVLNFALDFSLAVVIHAMKSAYSWE